VSDVNVRRGRAAGIAEASVALGPGTRNRPRDAPTLPEPLVTGSLRGHSVFYRLPKRGCQRCREASSLPRHRARPNGPHPGSTPEEGAEMDGRCRLRCRVAVALLVDRRQYGLQWQLCTEREAHADRHRHPDAHARLDGVGSIECLDAGGTGVRSFRTARSQPPTHLASSTDACPVGHTDIPSVCQSVASGLPSVKGPRMSGRANLRGSHRRAVRMRQGMLRSVTASDYHQVRRRWGCRSMPRDADRLAHQRDPSAVAESAVRTSSVRQPTLATSGRALGGRLCR